MIGIEKPWMPNTWRIPKKIPCTFSFPFLMKKGMTPYFLHDNQERGMGREKKIDLGINS